MDNPSQHHDHDHDDLPAGHLALLTSVGIDIGSATSHLIFSRLRVGYPALHRRHPEILEREILSRSAVLLTPFAQDGAIEPEPLQDLIHNAFQQAGLTPQEIDTGAVIMTGEAARRRNARRIADLFADGSGRFVCATAGPRLETVLAAHGSGAIRLSRGQGLHLLNIDIGGGTTKVGYIQKGHLTAAAAWNIGARLVAFRDDGKLTRVEKAGRHFLERAGFPLSVGDEVDGAICSALAEKMAEALFGMLLGAQPPSSDLSIISFAQLPPRDQIDGILFSGGVAEYIYGREQRSFGDLGSYLGGALRKQAQASGLRLLEGAEGLRATVIGAAHHSMQLSGETIFLPDAHSLPIRNLRVVPLSVTWEPPIAERTRKAVLAALGSLDPEVKGDPLALALSTPPFIGYGSALELAEGLRAALRLLPPQDRPSALVFGQNIGQVVGGALAAEFKIPCIDEVALSELDFIDIGRPVSGESYVPVVIKSLTFGT